MIEAETVEHFFEAVRANEVTVVDFYATWCNPCQQILKILPRLQEGLSDRAGVIKVDIDKLKPIKEMYKVTKVPTFIFFKNSQEVGREEGVRPLRQIQDRANHLLDVL